MRPDRNGALGTDRYTGAVVGLALALSAVGCSVHQAATTNTAAPPGGVGASATQASDSAGAGTGTDAPQGTLWAPVTSEVFAVPAASLHDDGSLYVRLIGSSDQEFLASGTDVRDFQEVTIGDSAPSLIRWHSTLDAQTYVARVGDEVIAIGSQQPAAAVEVSGTLYFQQGDAVVAWVGGAVSGKFALPTVAPSATVPPGYKGLTFGGPSVVSGIVPSISGEIVAFAYTGAGAAVIDLSTGLTVGVATYTALGAAVRTANGDFAVLAWNALDGMSPVVVLVVDGESLKVLSVSETGVPLADMLQATILPSTEHDAVVAISVGDTPSIILNVWTLDETALTPIPELPVNAGLQIAAKDMNSVYVYNGPAQNTVGLLDLTSGRFESDLPEFRAPDGSYVVGLLRE